MSEVKFIRPTGDIVRHIAANMRAADAVEVRASHGHTPMQALHYGVEQSHYSIVVSVNDEPCAILGLAIRDILTGTGVPWLLSTDAALKYKREFLKQSPPVIAEMLTICPRLFNYVHAENRVSIRWLKWLGFTIGSPEDHGSNGELFHRFHLEKVIDNV